MFSGKQRRDADAAGEEVVHEGGFFVPQLLELKQREIYLLLRAFQVLHDRILLRHRRERDIDTSQIT